MTLDLDAADALADLVQRYRPAKPTVTQLLALLQLMHFGAYDRLTEKELRQALKPSQLLAVADPKSREELAAEEREAEARRVEQARREALQRQPTERVAITLEFDVDVATGAPRLVKATERDSRRCTVRADTRSIGLNGTVVFTFTSNKSG